MRTLLLASCAFAAVLLLWTLLISRGAGISSGGFFRLSNNAVVTPGHEQCDRSPNTEALHDFVKAALSKVDTDPLLPQSKTFDGFVKELTASINRHPLPARTIDVVFGNFGTVHPACNGDWMEFGVFMGTSINKTAKFRARHCLPKCPPVFGFDTFEGLPEDWVGDRETTFRKGAFSLQGRLPPVEPNAFLIKGLFADSIPVLLEQQKEWARQFGGNRKAMAADAPLAYLHIDCDLFIGAHDAFKLLSHKIVPGTVILFDELVNYNRWRDNEAKALWLWLEASGAKIATIGTWGPLPGMPKGMVMEPDVLKGHGLEFQSAGFVVISKPGSTASFL